MLEKVDEIKSSCESELHLFTRMASSICPEIYSMEEVK